MRVFELARDLKVSSADVLTQAATLDFEVYTALSVLEPAEIAAIRKRCSPQNANAIAQKKELLAAKRHKIASRFKEHDRTEVEALAAAIARAKKAEAIAKGLPTKPAPPKQPASAPAVPAKPKQVVAAAATKTVPDTPAAKTVTGGAPAAKPVAGIPAAKPATDSAPIAPKKAVKPTPTAAPDDDDDVWGEEVKVPPRKIVRTTPPKAQGRRDLENKRVATPPSTRRSAPGFKPISSTPATVASAPEARTIQLHGATIVKDLAEMLGLRPNRVIADLMQLNVLASINQRVELETATKIAEKYGFKIEVERQKRSTERRPVLRRADADDDIPEDRPEDLCPRPPVITFLGHVDHGKTSLMDRIRNAHVAHGEAGGITQHIGAYTVDLDGRRITFLDTPGHAAFSAMRARGASLTDIAVIIVAADDGVMPQTQEAIKHAKQAGVQIMVAINKCDLPQAKPDQVRQQLAGEGLTPEEWGGDIVCCEVSAMTGKGVDHLLEMILLQADVLELSANANRRADGYVIEAQLALGLGPTASVLVTGGTLKIGDAILCGQYFGKIRSLVDDRGRKVKEAKPATAVKLTGISGVPEAGTHFRVMLSEKRARELAEAEAESRKTTELSSSVATSIDALMQRFAEQEQLELHVIVKADTQGSCEAIEDSLKEIKSSKVTLQLIYSGIGNVNTNDVQRAASGRAVIVGFHVGCEPGVQSLARHEGVRITTHRIIYELLDNVKQEMLNLLKPEYFEVVRGHAEIRAIFHHGKRGTIAGCQMLDGMLRLDARARILRKKQPVFDGKFASLHHFQDAVTQVDTLQECGVRFEGFEAFAEGDIIECYSLEEKERTL